MTELTNMATLHSIDTCSECYANRLMEGSMTWSSGINRWFALPLPSTYAYTFVFYLKYIRFNHYHSTSILETVILQSFVALTTRGVIHNQSTCFFIECFLLCYKSGACVKTNLGIVDRVNIWTEYHWWQSIISMAYYTYIVSIHNQVWFQAQRAGHDWKGP